MSHFAFQPVPQAVSQPAGLFVPQALLDDVRLKPVERNAWMMFRSLADANGIATVGYESLRTALLCAPGSPRAALSTVSRAVLCLRLSTWIEQTGYRRDPRTSLSQGASYTVRNEPLSFVEACLGSEDYLRLLERGLTHTHVTVRELARDILDQAMSSPDERARLPFALQEQVRRLHQQAHFPKDGSGGGSSPPDSSSSDSSGQHLSFSDPTFPKRTSEAPETVRTVSKVYKVPTYSTPQKNKKEEIPEYRTPPAETCRTLQAKQAETPGLDASARFRQLALDQQDYLSGRLRSLPVEQRRDVLAEWHVRCAAGAVRDAAAYLFGLIRKALQGTFRLWAARKNPAQEQPAAKVQEAPRRPPQAPSTAEPPVPVPADKPASRAVALAHLERIQAMLQGKAPVPPVRKPPAARHPQPPSTAEPPVPAPADEPASREVALAHLERIQAMSQGKAPVPPARKPPEARHPQTPLARALAQAMPPAGSLRPLAAFLTPAMETVR
ncbi:MAG: hypothetical protein LBE85_09210 [Candidatus Accumulibacter sp.]|jgi:hypothetical protein|nr:hypothetical protein [Accumulibacter sp.]